MLNIADALEANENEIRIENEADVADAQQANLDKSLVARLLLKPGKARQSPTSRTCLNFNLMYG